MQNMDACGQPGCDPIATPLQIETREDLIMKHLPQVRIIALRLRERLPASVSMEDLISAGTLGLIAAIDKFDQVHDVKLSTYAEFKIRGAILDALRELDWVPRQQRKRFKLIDAAVARLEQGLQRRPCAEEIAAHLGITVPEYHRWNSEATGVNLASLESALGEDQARTKLDLLADSRIESPAATLERWEYEQLLTAAITDMPPLEKTVLQFYFFEEMTLREIAGIMQLHESRISQLKSRGLGRLRAAIGATTEPPATPVTKPGAPHSHSSFADSAPRQAGWL